MAGPATHTEHTQKGNGARRLTKVGRAAIRKNQRTTKNPGVKAMEKHQGPNDQGDKRKYTNQKKKRRNETGTQQDRNGRGVARKTQNQATSQGNRKKEPRRTGNNGEQTRRTQHKGKQNKGQNELRGPKDQKAEPR